MYINTNASRKFYLSILRASTTVFVKFTDEPKFHYFLCHHHNLDGQKAYGSALSDNQELAILKSYWEAMERACLYYSNHVVKNETKLSGEVTNNIIVNDFLEPSEQISIDEIKRLNLYESVHYNTGEKVWLPNQLVFSDYDYHHEPFIRIPISTGAAIGEDFDSTFERGFLELVERDSFMLFWLTQKTSTRIDISKNASLSDLNKYLKRYLLDLYVFDITTDLGIPSVMSVLIDYTGLGPAVSVGLKASFHIVSAIKSAIFESLQVRTWMRYTYLQALHNDNDFGDIAHFAERGLQWYGVDSIKKLDFILNVSPTSLDEVAKTYQTNTFKEWFANSDLELYYTDITLPQVKNIGFTCLKVNAPFLHPLYLHENYAYLYSKHIEQYSQAKGLNIANHFPHPFI
jgi:thiazole/oxazole-forming peptide maturase SagD family component